VLFQQLQVALIGIDKYFATQAGFFQVRAGHDAAAALANAARRLKFEVINRQLPERGDSTRDSVAGLELRKALRDIKSDDRLVLWLRPDDIAALGARAAAAQIYVSGLMSKLEDAPIPPAWRRYILMTYPFDPPDLRRVRMNFPHGWLHTQGLLVTADRIQSNTYIACMIVADVIDDMLDSFVQDFLVERLEVMSGSRFSTGYFPRVSLASGQRFASKGGYIVKFDGAAGTHVARDGAWIVP